MLEIELENARKYYVKDFQRQNKPDKLFNNTEIERIGTKIVDLLKEEDLTHDQAYASLQYAYNLIKYESNFLKLQ